MAFAIVGLSIARSSSSCCGVSLAPTSIVGSPFPVTYHPPLAAVAQVTTSRRHEGARRFSGGRAPGPSPGVVPGAPHRGAAGAGPSLLGSLGRAAPDLSMAWH